MTQASIAVVALLILAIMSVRANSRFSHKRRLPMQWSLSGTVNWTAPRPLALAFTPCLAAVILVGTTIATMVQTPRPGQEGMAVPVIAAMSLTLIAAHLLHLWLIGRTIDA